MAVVVGEPFELARLDLGDRLLQHLLVELEADLADLARLLLAEQVAGAADVEIVAGQREAGAQRCRATAAPSAASRRVSVSALRGGMVR